MFAVLRVRFNTNNDPGSVWSDSMFHSWWNPWTPNSIAHYWTTAARGHLDMGYQLFPSIQIADPRIGAVGNARDALKQGVVDQAVAQLGFRADAFSHVFIWFAQRTDLFGGSAVRVPLADGGTRDLPVTVCDHHSRFDQVVHEVGHALGFGHPWGPNGPGYEEYGSPYDIMGGYDASWVRPASPDLPDGVPLPGSPANATPRGRIMGPLVSAAQLYTRLAAFRGAPAVAVDPAFPLGSRQVTVHARDTTADPIMAMVPDSAGGFIIEYRRGQGYDQGIGDVNGPVTAVVIHRMVSGRLEYHGSIPLDNLAGDTDYHSYSGHFAVRLEEVGPNGDWVRLRIGGGNFWRQWRANLQERGRVERAEVTSEPYVVNSPACVAGTYELRSIRTAVASQLAVESYGFELPLNRWWIDGTPIPAGRTVQTLRLPVSVPNPQPGGAATVTPQDVDLVCTLDQGRLTVETHGAPAGNFAIQVRVSVDESDRGVLGSVYPTVSDELVLSFNGARVELDPTYAQAFEACFGWVHERYEESTPTWVILDPSDPAPYLVDPVHLPDILRFEAVVAALQRLDEGVAAEVAEFVIGRYGLVADSFAERVKGFSGTMPEFSTQMTPIQHDGTLDADDHPLARS